MKLARILAASLIFASVGFSWSQTSSAWISASKWSSSSITCLDPAALPALEEKAANGDLEAADDLGSQYLSDCAGERKPSLGMSWLSAAASGGNVHAQVRLGQAYQNGEGVTKNMPAALAWYEKAAAQGSSRAKNNLGVYYLTGTARNPARSAHLFEDAAAHGLVEAAYNLATLYDQGLGVRQDYAQARKFYRQAADNNDADAEYRLGMLFDQGLGGEKDSSAALALFQRAAADGSEDAQIRLGIKSPSEANTVNSGYFQYVIAQAMFEGKGMKRDPQLAFKFLEQSAEAGYPPAFLAMGRMYARGDGVNKDEAKSIAYLEQAIAHDSKYDMAYNALAWTLVTAADPAIRNPDKGREYALKAIETSGGKHSYEFDTLAHAYYGLGDLDHAVESEAKAVALEPANGSYQQALAEFKNARDRANPAK